MKRFIHGIPPILLLIVALTFMTQYKQLNDLTDTEKYEIRTFVEAAESDDGKDKEKKQDNSIASSIIDAAEDKEVVVDPNMTYQITVTDDEKFVNVHDDDGDIVFQARMEHWQENIEYYYEKYRLGSF